jgi:hypothetical protein
LCAAAVLVCGCGYPAVTPDGYEFAKALHTALLERDEATLPVAEKWLAEAAADGRVGATERELFAEQIERAREGEWESAAAEVRALLSAQNVEE